MTDTATRVRKLVALHLGVTEEAAEPEAILAEDLGADSLDLVELEMELEEEFGFRFPDQDGTLKMSHTVGDIVRLVDEARVA